MRGVRVRDVAEDHVLEGDLALLRHAEADGALVLVGVPATRAAARPPPCGARAAPTARSAPRPSRARASAARRGSAPRSPASSARGRCPRRAARTRRPSRAREASCTVPSSRRRCAARRLEKARNAPSSAAMLVGAHVSTAGGLVQAHERAVERGCEAMQVFNQSPRMWRPTRWKPRRRGRVPRRSARTSPIKSVTIHAVYLDQSGDQGPGDAQEVRRLADPRAADGRRDRADGVVLHPGSTVGEPHEEALPRVGEMLEARARGVERLPAAAREHRRRREHARPLVRGAARVGRPGWRRQATGRLPRLLPHVRVGLRHPRPRTGSTDVVERSRRRSASAA